MDKIQRDHYFGQVMTHLNDNSRHYLTHLCPFETCSQYKNINTLKSIFNYPWHSWRSNKINLVRFFKYFFSPSLCLFRFASASSAKFVPMIDCSVLITYPRVLSLERDRANVTRSLTSTGQQLHLTGTMATIQSFPRLDFIHALLFRL